MSLRTALIHMSALFPDHIISRADEEIRHHEDKRTSGPSHRKPQCFHPYSQQSRRRGQKSNRGKTSSLLSGIGQVPEAV